MTRVAGLILVVVLSLAGSMATRARDDLWAGYSAYVSPYLTDLPATQSTPPLTNRVVLILIRGLSADVSQSMVSLNALRDHGADYTLQIAEPPYRAPQIMTLLTGALPEFHGYTTNFSTARPLPDNLITQVAASRGNPSVFGSVWWDATFGRQVLFTPLDFSDLPGHDEGALRLAREQIGDATFRSNLIIIELDLIDQVANTEPDSLDAAITTTDSRLTAFFTGLDQSRTTIVVTSDRGALAANGDIAAVLASRVPLVMSGAGVRIGSKGSANSLHLAPTLAVLLGVPTPAIAQGTPLFPALVIPSAQIGDHVSVQTTRLVNLYERWSEVTRRPRFAAELLQQTSLPDPVDPVRWFRNFEASLNDRASMERADALANSARSRLPFVMGIALCLLAVTGLLVTTHRLAPLLFTVLYWGVWLGWTAATLPGNMSLASFQEGNPTQVFAQLNRGGTIALLLPTGVAVLTALREPDALSAISFTMTSLLTGCVSLMLSACAYYWYWGTAFFSALPDGDAIVGVLSTLTRLGALMMQIPATGSLQVPLPIIAAIVTVVAHILFAKR